MAEIKKKVGYIACHSCGERAVVKLTGGGAFSYTCQECDFAPYATKGTKAYSDWEKKIAFDAVPVAGVEVVAETAKTPEKKPEKTATKAGGLILG